MVSCKECINYDVCSKSSVNCDRGSHCIMYKDRINFINLPCKIGDTVYAIDNLGDDENIIVQEIVISITFTIDRKGNSKIFVKCKGSYDFEWTLNKNLFLTYEQAQQAI